MTKRDVSECRQQAAHCRNRAETANDERVRALLISMALIWAKLAEEAFIQLAGGQTTGVIAPISVCDAEPPLVTLKLIFFFQWPRRSSNHIPTRCCVGVPDHAKPRDGRARYPTSSASAR